MTSAHSETRPSQVCGRTAPGRRCCEASSLTPWFNQAPRFEKPILFYGAPGLVFYSGLPVRQLVNRADLVAFLSAAGRRHCVLPESELHDVAPLLMRRLTVQAQAGVFSVRIKRLFENEPERAARILVLVTAE